MSQPTQAFRGTFGALPLAPLLARALERRSVGTLVLEHPERGRHALLLQGGAVARVRVGDKAVLAEWDGLARPPEEVLRQRLGPDWPGLPIEEDTSAEGRMPTRAESTRAAWARLLIELIWIEALGPRTGFGFFEGQDLIGATQTQQGSVLDPLCTLSVLLLQTSALPDESALAAQLGARTLRLHPASRAPRLRLPRSLQGVVEVLRAKPVAWPELRAAPPVEVSSLVRLVYLLAVTRQLDLGMAPLGVDEAAVMAAQSLPARAAATSLLSASKGPRVLARAPRVPALKGLPEDLRSATAGASAEHGVGDSTTPERLAPGAAPVPALAGRSLAAAEIEECFQKLQQQTHFQALGVSELASSEEVSQAFAALAKKWHPDRLPLALQTHKPMVTRIFSRLSEAHTVLSDPKAREQYQAQTSEGADDDEQRRVAAILAASQTLQKAEIMVRKQDYAQALALVKESLLLDPEQSEAQALRAWLGARALPPGDSGFEEALAVLSRAVEQQPSNVRVRLYRARIFKQAGALDAAIRDFRVVAQHDPSQVEAARELRLYEMRRAHQESNQGLFGLWRKRS